MSFLDEMTPELLARFELLQQWVDDVGLGVQVIGPDSPQGTMRQMEALAKAHPELKPPV